MEKWIALLFLAKSALGAPLSLKDSIKYALEHSPALSQEAQRNKISELDLTTRARAFYPSIDLESSHGLGNTHPTGANEPQSPWLSTAKLKVTENLYDNGVSWIRYAQGKNQRQSQQLQFERTRDLLVLDVIRNFYTLSEAARTLEAKQTQRKVLEQQYTSVSKFYHQGLKTKRDYLRFKAQSQSAAIDERVAQTTMNKAQLELIRLLGVPPEETNTFAFESIAPEALTLSTAIETPKIKKTYEYRIAQSNLEAQKSESDLARRNYWPELNLTTGAYYQNSNYLGSRNSFGANETYGWNILLNLNYNFWDWGTRARDVEKSDAQVLILEHELKKSEQSVANEIKQLRLDIEQYQANLSVSEELLKAQEEAYNVIKRDYYEGRTEYQDLITSLTGLLDARVGYFRSRYELAGLLSRNKYYQGTLYGPVTQ